MFKTYIKNYLDRVLKLTVISVICLSLWACSNNANADIKDTAKDTVTVSPELEKQVLSVIRKNPEVIIESIKAYQQQQEQSRKNSLIQEFAKQLTTDPESIIGNSPYLGSKENKIFLIEFSDFQCPYCAKAQATLKEFMTKHKEKVTFVYKHFPLTDIHPEAMPAAKAAWAAQQQGKFWGYHDFLFASYDKLGENLYLEIANKLKLDINKFNDDRKKAEAEIAKDINLAQAVGINGTPTLIMNDQYISGAVELSKLEATLKVVSDR
jgi:protein-disulfide isomerase